MMTSPEIWVAFARTFSMLFLVLGLIVLVLYLARKLSFFSKIKGPKNHIHVVSVHHLSQKEKLVLVDVEGKTLLLGVTPSGISRLSSVRLPDIPAEAKPVRFYDHLIGKLATQKERNA